MHLGFSIEERRRCRTNPHKLFENRFPLAEMGMTRADSYRYILDVWGLETKASACAFCPFHRNYFYRYLGEHEPETYQKVLAVDYLLQNNTPRLPMDSELFISKSRKRLEELTADECQDRTGFLYQGKLIWDGF